MNKNNLLFLLINMVLINVGFNFLVYVKYI